MSIERRKTIPKHLIILLRAFGQGKLGFQLEDQIRACLGDFFPSSSWFKACSLPSLLILNRSAVFMNVFMTSLIV